MMLLRSPRWAGMPRNLEGTRKRDALNIYRTFSSNSARGRIRSKFYQSPSIHLPPWRTVPLTHKPLGCLQSKRFASTDHPPPSNVDPPPVAAPVAVANPVDAPSDQFISSPLDSITGAEYPRIVEHVGYLKDLGLDYGWGPTACLQTLLEYVHIYSGTGWGVSIIITACIVRLALLKTFVNASDTQARIAVLTPHINPLKAQLKEARTAKDSEQLRRISIDLKQLYNSAGVQMWRLFVPMLQVPIGFATFRLMRGMADLPVPGLDDGGFLWLTDLTQSDPYFILPIVTGIAFHLTFKRGGDLGANPTQSLAMKTVMIWVVPTISSIFMLFWPGALQLTFACTSMFSFAQASCLQQPWIRTFLNIQPLPKPEKDTPRSSPNATHGYEDPSKPSAKKGLIGGAIAEVKGAASQVMKTARNLRDSPEDELKGSRKRSPADVKRAQAYDERRRKEIAQEKLSSKRRV